MGSGGSFTLSTPTKKVRRGMEGRRYVILKYLYEAFGSKAERTISTRQLHTLLCLHPAPINQVVFLGPSGRAHLEGGFPLRCFQRLSRPHVATQQCRWHDNWNTRGASIPVLSY